MTLVVAGAIVAPHAEQEAQASTPTSFNCHFSSKTIKLQNAASRSGYATPITDAANNWNRTGAEAKFTMVSSGANVRVYDGVLAEDVYGVEQSTTGSERCATGGHWTRGREVILNRRLLDGRSVFQRRITTAHELGHSVGLGHEDRIGKCSTLMRSYGEDLFECNTDRPQADDLTGIWRLYNWGYMR